MSRTSPSMRASLRAFRALTATPADGAATRARVLARAGRVRSRRASWRRWAAPVVATMVVSISAFAAWTTFAPAWQAPPATVIGGGLEENPRPPQRRAIPASWRPRDSRREPWSSPPRATSRPRRPPATMKTKHVPTRAPIAPTSSINRRPGPWPLGTNTSAATRAALWGPRPNSTAPSASSTSAGSTTPPAPCERSPQPGRTATDERTSSGCSAGCAIDTEDQGRALPDETTSILVTGLLR